MAFVSEVSVGYELDNISLCRTVCGCEELESDKKPTWSSESSSCIISKFSTPTPTMIMLMPIRDISTISFLVSAISWMQPSVRIKRTV